MIKRLNPEFLADTDGPMNSVALEDARNYLHLDNAELTILEEKALRARKRKIVTSSKKQDRKYSRELTRRAEQLSE
jgi:hypothetical protein